MKKYTITLTEEQMRLIADMVEDCTRFLSGQCEMQNTTSVLKEGIDVRNHLHDIVKHMVTPELGREESYGWDGGKCSNKYQRRAIAMGYGIYREILHFLAIKYNWNNVYSSETLICKEQGPLIKIKEQEE